MENVRTPIFAICLLVVIAVLMNTSCGEVSTGELRFVERQPGGLNAEQNNQAVVPNSASSSKVEISEANQEILKVCVLPFINNSGDPRLDGTTFLIETSIDDKLEEFNRMFTPVVIEEDQYKLLADELGRDAASQPDEAIAAALQDMHQADVLVFGEIRVEDGDVYINSYIYSYEGKFHPQPLDPYKVDTTRIFAFINLFSDELVKDIIEYLQI